MRYSKIDYFEIANGADVGVSLYTQGCPRVCPGCFNTCARDYDGGKEYTIEVRDDIVNACSRPGIKRLTLIGGEPFIERNKKELIILCSLVKEANKDIKIWAYSGDIYENLKNDWLDLLQFIDVLVDGPFEQDKRDVSLKFKGSSNQRLIDIQKTISEGKVILYE